MYGYAVYSIASRHSLVIASDVFRRLAVCVRFAAPHGTFAAVRSRTSLLVRQVEQAEICEERRARPRLAEQTESGNPRKQKT